jgi:hypothetical protein
MHNAEVVEFKDVFRYTPQISSMIKAIDDQFPAFDMGEDWGIYVGKSLSGNGPKPQLWSFRESEAMITEVLDAAQERARSIGGRNVAVLVASDRLFDQFLHAAKTIGRGGYYLVAERSPSSDLRHAGRRFILSKPEYVAGLQFTAVRVTNVDLIEAPPEANVIIRRRFISNIYLAVSRAEQEVYLTSCEDRGGVSDILDIALREHIVEHRKFDS